MIPTRRLDPKVIAYLFDIMETNILEKVKEDFRFEMDLMKNDMFFQIMRVVASVLRNLCVEDGYQETTEDFEVAGSSGEEKYN